MLSRDAIPLKALIALDPSSTAKLPHSALRGQWVQVEGQLQFQSYPGQADSWLTVLVMRPDEQHPLFDPSGQNDQALIQVKPADKNYFLSW